MKRVFNGERASEGGVVYGYSYGVPSGLMSRWGLDHHDAFEKTPYAPENSRINGDNSLEIFQHILPSAGKMLGVLLALINVEKL